MSADWESWKHRVETLLWMAHALGLTDAEACRYYEAGLPPAAAVSRIIEDRERTSR